MLILTYLDLGSLGFVTGGDLTSRDDRGNSSNPLSSVHVLLLEDSFESKLVIVSLVLSGSCSACAMLMGCGGVAAVIRRGALGLVAVCCMSARSRV